MLMTGAVAPFHPGTGAGTRLLRRPAAGLRSTLRPRGYLDSGLDEAEQHTVAASPDLR